MNANLLNMSLSKENCRGSFPQGGEFRFLNGRDLQTEVLQRGRVHFVLTVVLEVQQEPTLLVILALVSWLLTLQVAVAPTEILHLLEYGGLGYLIGWAAKISRFVSWPTLGCSVLVTLAGSRDEAIQYLLPNRYFEVRDILLNMWCGTVGLVAWLLLPHPSSLPGAGK